MKEETNVAPPLAVKYDFTPCYRHCDEVIRHSNVSMHLHSILQNPIEYIHLFRNLLRFNICQMW